MKEFITQDKLTDEFIDFLKETNYWDNYVRELSYAYDCLNYIGIYGENNTLTLLSAYLESGNIEEYLHIIATREPIIDVRVPSLSISPLDNIPMLSGVEHDFIWYINEKYNDKIKSTCLEKKSLLIRWMKEENTLGALKNEYGEKESIIESINPYLESRIPYMIFPKINPYEYPRKMLKLRDNFNTFYTRIITDEKS